MLDGRYGIINKCGWDFCICSRVLVKHQTRKSGVDVKDLQHQSDDLGQTQALVEFMIVSPFEI